MLGFIIKDLAILKSNMKYFLSFMIIYAILANQMGIFSVLSFFSIFLMFSTFTYESYNNWDAFAATLPNGRKNSVKAKYLATIL